MVIELMLLTAVIFLAGYIFGKRTGYNRGYQQGMASSPLLLREQSLNQGWCCFCQPVLDNQQHQTKE